MEVETQRDLLRKLLKTGKSISKAEAIEKAKIKGATTLYKHIAKLRSDGYVIKTQKGAYTMVGYSEPKLKTNTNRGADYIAARVELIPEAESYADNLEARGTDGWSRVFAERMDVLATEHLGCKASWQL